MIFRFSTDFKSVLKSRHSTSHPTEQGQWNQIDPLDQDVVSGMVGEEDTRNFMVGFGKSMNEME